MGPRSIINEIAEGHSDIKDPVMSRLLTTNER